MTSHHIEAQVDHLSELIADYAIQFHGRGLCSEATAALVAIRAQLRSLIESRADLLALAKQYASECAGCDGTGRTGHSDHCDYWLPDYARPCTCGQTRACDCADIRAAIARATP